MSQSDVDRRSELARTGSDVDRRSELARTGSDVDRRSELARTGGRNTITYRGRNLEEVLPKIREELGPDAVIERQRTGLVGGVGGFFQREMIEVDARPATPQERGGLDVVAGDDEEERTLRAATAPPPDPDRDEGLSSPAMRRIAEQSEPFAALLRDAQADAAQPAGDDAAPAGEDEAWEGWADEEPAGGPGPGAPSYGAAAYRQTGHGPSTPDRPSRRAERPAGADEAAPSPGEAPGADEALAGARPRPAAADNHEAALAERGLSPQLAAAIVSEAVSHAMPFAPARGGLKRQVRATLARRIPVLAGFGGEGRTIALVGAAGAGKTRAAASIAAAYAAGSDLPVVCLSLRPSDVGAELAELLDPHGVAVRPVADGAAARAQIGARAGRALVVVDTPAVSPRDADAIAALAGDLRAVGVTETHVVLPATVAGPVARAALGAFAPLDPTALLLTHADETDHLGALVDLAIAEGLPLSYVASGAGPVRPGADLVPADPAALAARLVP